MMQDEAAPMQKEAMAPEAEQAQPEDQIVDQIGMLLQKLPPEKQRELVMKLGELMGAPQGAMEGTGDPEAGANGVPAEQV